MGLLQILIVWIFFNTSINADIKYWRQSVSLGDPKQWEDGKLPCYNQESILPEEVMLAAAKDFRFSRKTILPENGMILFEDLLEYVFPLGSDQEKEKNCNGSSSIHRFKKQLYHNWFDPKNWISLHQLAMPHAFQIPCRYDHVRFPANVAFKVKITDRPVDIATMTVNKVPLGK